MKVGRVIKAGPYQDITIISYDREKILFYGYQSSNMTFYATSKYTVEGPNHLIYEMPYIIYEMPYIIYEMPYIIDKTGVLYIMPGYGGREWIHYIPEANAQIVEVLKEWFMLSQIELI